MNHFASPDFWKEYEKLPKHIKELSDKNFDIVNGRDAAHAHNFKKVGNYRSVRVGKKHRAVAIEIEEGLLWFWIGTHPEYDKLLK